MDLNSGNCEEIQILISKFVDDEVTDEERSRVESHVITCESCSCVMLQYVEMAALFAETPMLQPEPDLRASLFREIGNAKEAAQRKTRATAQSPRPWYLLPEKAKPAPFAPAPPRSITVRIMQAASPLMMAAVPIVFIIGALILSGKWLTGTDTATTEPSFHVPIQPIPTYEAPLAQSTNEAAGVPPAELTKALGVSMLATAASTTTYMSATATLGPYQLIQLTQPTPVWEDGDATDKTGWHSMRDSDFGYKLSYPSNWWTRNLNNTRYFYPWGAGGTEYAPYWVELSVDPNSDGLTAATANNALCGGACDSVNDVWLKRSSQDAHNFYHVGYLFDAQYIYKLQLVVPLSTLDGLGALQDRIAAGDQIFGTMSGRLILADASAQKDSAFGSVLFLKGANPDQGSDFYLTSNTGGTTRRLTWDGGVKNYAMSPDMESVAYATTEKNQARNAWASHIYMTAIAPTNSSDTAASPLVSMDAIHDLAWYSDHELVFLAENAGALGLYKLDIPATGATPAQKRLQGKPVLLVSLGANLAGARSLAVSPDRQLITFIAPLGESQTSDIYAVRPDGSDLRVLISHSSTTAPIVNGAPVLAEDSQAIKSYQWMDGHLESDGYQANILFTCGNSYSPSFVLGGYLYSAPRTTRNPLIDPFSLVNYEPEKLQIIHVAYSTWGKVAFTGYYKDFDGRADKLEGLWEANVLNNGALSTPVRLPIPGDYHGITDLQWTPDGASLIYRETIININSQSARYDGESAFRMVSLNPTTGHTTVLYNNAP